jgi:uncharacterized protein (TIGR03086 family)
MTTSNASREQFFQALAGFNARVSATPADKWNADSPCEGWVASDVVAHLVNNLIGLEAGLNGGDFFTNFGQPVQGDITEAWQSVYGNAASVLDQAEAAGVTTVIVRGNAVPVAGMVDGLMRDAVIHTWDLARAVGGDESIPDDLLQACIVALGQVADASRVPGLYGPIVATESGADDLVRMLALSGRKA